MNLDEVIGKKREILDSLRSDVRLPEWGLSFQSAWSSHKKTKKMFAVGYSRQDEERYRLEIRVRSRTGQSYGLATEIQEKLGEEEVNIGILQRIAIPKEFTAAAASEENADANSSLRSKQSPLHLGLSVGHQNGKSGTLGGFLLDVDSGEQYLLSCNHVLALCNQARRGDSIYQPGPSDIEQLLATYEVAELSDYVVLKDRDANQVDSALAKINSGFDVLGNVVPPGFPQAEQPILAPLEDYPPIETIVEKYGRTTGLTKGRLQAVSLDGVEIDYHLPDGEKKNYTFDNVLEIFGSQETPIFSKHGDSGSLVVASIDNVLHGLGIVFAGGVRLADRGQGTIQVTFCCALKDVLRAYDRNKFSWMQP